MKHPMSKVRPILYGSLALLAFLLVPALASAQAGTVQGQVVDASTGQPLPSAQISIEGSGLGGLSNQQGRFLILNVPVGQQTIRAVLIGYTPAQSTVTVTAGGSSTVEFQMESSALEMEEIVVTGTGRPTERRQLSAEVSVVGQDDIQSSAASNVTELLQGRIPGAQINAVSASPGTAGLMSFRGPSSAIADQTPVIYIDGVRVDNARGIGSDFGGEQTSALADLAVADIERIEVTKGGAASTLYGADAASGVIQIFTKRGRPGEARFTARVEQGWDAPMTKFISDMEFTCPEDLGDCDVARAHPSWDPDFVKNNILQTTHQQSYYLSAVGGSDRIGYNISGRIQDGGGTQVKTGSTMYSLTSSLQAQLSDDLTADFSGSYLRHGYSRVPNGTTTTGAFTNAEVGDFLAFARTDNLAEALAVYHAQDIDESVDRFTLSTTLGYAPVEVLDLRGTIGVDKRVSEQRHNEQIEMAASSRQGRIATNQRDFTGLTLDFRGTLTYDVPGLTATSTSFGFQGFREQARTTNVTGDELALPGVREFDAAALVTANEGLTEVYNGGFFLLQQAGFADQLFLEAGVRFDGNTAFGSNVSYQAYPKVGLSYDMVSGGIAPDFFQAMRLRGNYGVTGKFPPPFQRDRTFTADPFLGESAPRFDNPGNADLEPERVTTVEAGLDASFLDNRVAFGLTAYRAVTTDAIFSVDEQPSTGQGAQLRNIGEIENRGLEASLNVDLVRNPGAVWDMNLTWSALRNEVKDLGGLPPFQLGSLPGRREFGRIEEGLPLGVRYSSQPVDTNGDGLPDSQARGVILHPETGEHMTPFPTSNGSIGSSISLPQLGLSIRAQGDWSRGSTVQDYAAAWSTFNGLPRIEFPTRYDLAGNEDGTYSYSQAFNYLLLNGDFFKLREVSVSYQLPGAFAARLGGSDAQLTFGARNLWTWVPSPQSIFAPDASRPYLLDPELAGYAEPSGASSLQLGGSQSVVLPPPHQFRFGFQISF